MTTNDAAVLLAILIASTVVTLVGLYYLVRALVVAAGALA